MHKTKRQSRKERFACCECVVGLTREANDDIRSDTDIWNLFYRKHCNAFEFGRVVMPSHLFENGILPVLAGQMKETTESRFACHQINDLMDNGARLGRTKADAETVAKHQNPFDDIREIATAIVVSCYINACKDDFPMASVDKFRRFAQKVLQVSGTSWTTRMRNDAIRAKEIAAFLDF